MNFFTWLLFSTLQDICEFVFCKTEYILWIKASFHGLLTGKLSIATLWQIHHT